MSKGSGATKDEKVVIEVMPTSLVDAHKAARNWGTYPANGANRYVTTRGWAEEVVAGAAYDRIVRAATADDELAYGELPEQW